MGWDIGFKSVCTEQLHFPSLCMYLVFLEDQRFYHIEAKAYQTLFYRLKTDNPNPSSGSHKLGVPHLPVSLALYLLLKYAHAINIAPFGGRN